MKMHVLRGRDGQVIGTSEADEVRTPDGTVEVEPELEEGQTIETVELRRSETFDLDSLHKRFAQRK